MPALAILPIKSFADAKQRLSEELTAGPRRALAEAMFSDVLVALRRATEVTDVLVVSADHNAQRIAGGHGAMVLDDTDEGHSAAASAGIQMALEHGFEHVLLIPGDCPLLDPKELDALIAAAGPGPEVLIIPDRHGSGTNALLLTPPSAIAPSFGPDSRRRHAAIAEAAGVVHRVVEVGSLAIDIDTPDDLATLQSTLAVTHGRAAHTRGMLNQLTRTRA
jgi:2-phospho-L-lactate/phosphoenolpyruvate guanylyltransferase